MALGCRMCGGLERERATPPIRFTKEIRGRGREGGQKRSATVRTTLRSNGRNAKVAAADDKAPTRSTRSSPTNDKENLEAEKPK